MDIEKNFDFVNVAIRVKPSSNRRHSKNVRKFLRVLLEQPPTLVIPERQLCYTFDNIFCQSTSQQTVYNEMVRPLVARVIEGYNSTVFAYGQTGTGKTHTIGSDSFKCNKINCGLIPRALDEIVAYNDDSRQLSIAVSFIEIYKEKVYDLLANSKRALQVKGFKINGLTKNAISNISKAHDLLFEGGSRRHIGETKQNPTSSRSHAIFTIYCNVKSRNKETESKLNLVDLAGSESVRKTGNEGSQFYEGININLGLLCIGQVINALSNNHAHVPYRQSTITTILQDSLNRKNFVTLIACITTNYEDMLETIQTLDFAQRAKKLKSRPELNCLLNERFVRNLLRPHDSTPHYQSERFFFRLQKIVRVNGLKKYLMQQALPSERMLNYSADDDAVGKDDEQVPQWLMPLVKLCVELLEDHLLDHLKIIIWRMSKNYQDGPANNCWGLSKGYLKKSLSNILVRQLRIVSDCRTFRDESYSVRNFRQNFFIGHDGIKETNFSFFGYLERLCNAIIILKSNFFNAKIAIYFNNLFMI